MTMPLFEQGNTERPGYEPIVPGAAVLRGFALKQEPEVLAAIRDIAARAPFRRMLTSRGFRMSVGMTNCGPLGWVSDRDGYRYDANDPDSGKPWPPMPDCFLTLASEAAASAGFAQFVPDACLINLYEPGAKMGLHQDRDERDFAQPIVSVSLGLPAIFLFGGLKRSDETVKIPLAHGDVVVWGGGARLRYHGILQLKDGRHPLLGSSRINLTLRKAG